MLEFACIQDCSVCPFACNRNVNKTKAKTDPITSLPEGLVKSSVQKVADDFIKAEKEEDTVSNLPDVVSTLPEVKEEPVVYEIHDEKKKHFWSKK